MVRGGFWREMRLGGGEEGEGGEVRGGKKSEIYGVDGVVEDL